MISTAATLDAVSAALLRRSGIVFVEPGLAAQPARVLDALDLELAELGFVASSRLRAALASLDDGELTGVRDAVCGAIAALKGSDREHVPLFRKFPDGVPDDTPALWWKKVLVHFMQAEGQPCLFCRRVGTTHVLRPCEHVVCDYCFDGSNYSACPVCEHAVDRTSPFFEPTPMQSRPDRRERVLYRVLDLGGERQQAAEALFRSLLARTQALSPTDRADLTAIVTEQREQVLGWLPARIVVRENVAVVFGSLFALCDPLAVLPTAREHLATATDVLRLIAVFSGADASLQGERILRTVAREDPRGRWWGKLAALFGTTGQSEQTIRGTVAIEVKRFRVAKLGRPLRRALLAVLEGFDSDALVEDMLRHRSYWVWIGEFLHPHEYARRYPNVARAFAIVRGKGPDGTPAPKFRGFYAELESLAARRDAAGMADHLASRPGELARRFDHTLRLAADPRTGGHVVERLVAVIDKVSTPVLVGLAAALPHRGAPASVRVYFPKGASITGVADRDRRPPLPHVHCRTAVADIEDELLRRFAAQDPVETMIVDDALRTIIVPFNERTASRSAVTLTRGSVVDVPEGKLARLFLHWCEPETHGDATDLDLSVGLYSADWTHVGVCSYYQLQATDPQGRVIARSSGDLRSAPYPDGASEFVDVDLDAARTCGVRFAVMVVNAYAGMPFSALERGFAGLMFRDDARGLHFDPRTVELKFALQGERGVFLPLVFDLEQRRLHWLDVYAKGQFAFNNVANSNRAITKICPDLMAYFASGVRMSIHELGLFHAAARARRVLLRGAKPVELVRESAETPAGFLLRLRQRLRGTPADLSALPESPALALLLRGDLDLPRGSHAWSLFPERTPTTLAPSDLLVAD